MPAQGGSGDGGGSSPPPPSNTDPPPRVSDGIFSLQMDSEPGDYIGQGQTYDFSSPGDWISAGGSPDHLDFAVRDSGSTGSEYSAGFFAPPGQTLQAGVTYTDNADYTATPADAGIGMGAESRACNTGVGSFTIDEIAFAPDRTLRAAVLHWTFRCNKDDHAHPSMRSGRDSSVLHRRDSNEHVQRIDQSARGHDHPGIRVRQHAGRAATDQLPALRQAAVQS